MANDLSRRAFVGTLSLTVAGGLLPASSSDASAFAMESVIPVVPDGNWVLYLSGVRGKSATVFAESLSGAVLNQVTVDVTGGKSAEVFSVLPAKP